MEPKVIPVEPKVIPKETPREPAKIEINNDLLSSDDDDEDEDDDFIDPNSFKGLSKKKVDLSDDDDSETSTSTSSSESDTNEDIKKINLKTMKRNRYYS